MQPPAAPTTPTTSTASCAGRRSRSTTAATSTTATSTRCWAFRWSRRQAAGSCLRSVGDDARRRAGRRGRSLLRLHGRPGIELRRRAGLEPSRPSLLAPLSGSCIPGPSPGEERWSHPASMRVSIIVPALDEARAIVATLAALQSSRAAGHEVIVVDGGSVDVTVALATPLADRVVGAARGRAQTDERRGCSGRGRPPALSARRFAPARRWRLRTLVRALARTGRRWGPLRHRDRRERAAPWAPGRGADEPALARHRNRDRRPGDLRRAHAVSRGWRDWSSR